MKYNPNQFFESDDDSRPEYAEYRLPGDEPMKHEVGGPFIPKRGNVNYNKEPSIPTLPGQSLRTYYKRKK